ncbi:hypothetical protein Alches_20840 [Alicyclobacillus hesperidum subsp. aegles]|nr:hypothetical protein Alches_20840 [Alicyclobacillus hesperidum subsp. aegles]
MLRAKWSKYIIDDPYYSPFLTLDKEDFSFDSSRAVAHLTGGTLRSFNNVDHGVEVKLAELLKSENIHSEEALGAIFELWCTYHTRRDLRVVFNLLESHSTVGLLTWAIEDDAKRSLGTGRSSYSKGLEVIHDKVVKSIFFDEELSRVLA